MSVAFYHSMTDVELVGHVNGIFDASELSQALAGRVMRLVLERDELQRKLLSLQLAIAEDKLDAYIEIAERAA